MEPVGVINAKKRKRSSEVDSSRCFICQMDHGKTTQDKVLRDATENGLNTLKLKAEERSKYKDEHYRDVLERINAADINSISDIRWHKTCYADFTNAGHITRLKKKYENICKTKEHMTPAGENTGHSSSSRRSIIPSLDK